MSPSCCWRGVRPCSMGAPRVIPLRGCLFIKKSAVVLYSTLPKQCTQQDQTRAR